MRACVHVRMHVPLCNLCACCAFVLICLLAWSASKRAYVQYKHMFSVCDYVCVIVAHTYTDVYVCLPLSACARTRVPEVACAVCFEVKVCVCVCVCESVCACQGV